MAINVPAGVVAFQAIVLRPDELAAPPDHIYLQAPERYEFIDKSDITKRYVIALSTGLYAPIAGTGGTGVSRLVDTSDYASALLATGNTSIATRFGQTMFTADNWNASTNTPTFVSSTPPAAGTTNTYINVAPGHTILDTPINGITDVYNGDVIQFSTLNGVWTLFSKLPVMQMSDLTDGTATLASLTVQSINAQTGTTYTLVLADAGGNVDMNNASANALTIPTNALVPFPIGTLITVTQAGAGVTSIVAAGGVTLAKPTSRSFAISALLETATLFKIGTNTWRVSAS